ncbi:MAG: hypothetical protein ABL984_10185 [Pyrinomonadaceae bacterium]
MASVDVEWEKFLGGPVKPPALRMHATIARGGRIQLNANLFKRLRSPEAVWLFFNRRLQQIAIQATSLRMPEAFPIGFSSSKKSTRYISAASFCTHFGIKIRQTHSFNDPHFSADGKLILNLNETTIVSRTTKRRSAG